MLLEQAATVLPSSETYHVGHIRDEVTMQVGISTWNASVPNIGTGHSFQLGDVILCRIIRINKASMATSP